MHNYLGFRVLNPRVRVRVQVPILEYEYEYEYDQIRTRVRVLEYFCPALLWEIN